MKNQNQNCFPSSEPNFVRPNISFENNKVKVVEIQRSKGYSTRKSLNLAKLEKVIKLIKDIKKPFSVCDSFPIIPCYL